MDECEPLAHGHVSRRHLPRPRAAEVGRVLHGRAEQVDPIKPTLKPTGTKRLKPKCDALLATSAFKCILRRYNMDVDLSPIIDFREVLPRETEFSTCHQSGILRAKWENGQRRFRSHIGAGAYTRSHFSSS